MHNTEQESLIEHKIPETIEEYWEELLKSDEVGDFNQVEYLIIHRPEQFFYKMPGEDELYQRLKEGLGREPLVKLNDSGILVPIEKQN